MYISKLLKNFVPLQFSFKNKDYQSKKRIVIWLCMPMPNRLKI